YFKDLAADRRRQGVDGADDLLGAMIAAADDDGQRMNEWDMLAICTELAVAGHETTTNAVAKGIIGLMDQRDRWDDLKADPAGLPDPDRIDFTRPRGGHLTFGYGPHFCLGAALARLELRVSLQVLINRLPDMTLEAPDSIPWRPNHVLPGPAAVWVKP